MTSTAPLAIPYPPRSTGVVWHYTDEAGLRGILQSSRLWASPPEALNDTAEFTYGLDRVQELWDLDRAQFHPDDPDASAFVSRVLSGAWRDMTREPIFISCASSVRDSLSQWRGYAGTAGYAIGFRIDANLWFGAPDTLFDGPMDGASLPYWFDVVYEREAQEALVRAFFEYLALLPASAREPSALWAARQTIGPLPAFLKHSGFRDENEVRWIGSELTPPTAGPRERGPHLPIGAYALAPGAANLTKFPVVEIQCGPTCAPGVETTVSRILLDAGHEQVPVTRSAIPFR